MNIALTFCKSFGAYSEYSWNVTFERSWAFQEYLALAGGTNSNLRRVPVHQGGRDRSDVHRGVSIRLRFANDVQQHAQVHGKMKVLHVIVHVTFLELVRYTELRFRRTYSREQVRNVENFHPEYPSCLI